MRVLALLGLLLFSQDPDVDVLIKQLEDDSIEVREKAAVALVDLDRKAEEGVKARMASANGELGIVCRRILDQIAVPRKLRGVLPPVCRVSIDARDRSLKEVLEEFQRQTRIPMRPKDVGDARITVSFKDFTQLQALDAICKAAKFGWYFRSEGFGGPLEPEDPPDPRIQVHAGPEMRFHPGASRVIPSLFIRHYLVELQEIVLTRTNDFRKGKSRGVLNFGMHWPAGVKPYMAQFEVTSVLDDRGNELLEGHDDPNEPKGPRREFYNILRLYHRYRIRYPDKGVRKLASIRGEGRFHFILHEKKMVFDSIDRLVGDRKEIEGVTAEFLDITTEQNKVGVSYLKARLRIKGRGNTFPPRVQGRLENGTSTNLGAVPVGDPQEGLYDVYLYSQESKIVALEIVAESICGEDAFDFEFKDLTLP